LVGTTKVYPGVGADIVMESISLIDVPKGMFLHQKRVNECNRDVTPTIANTLQCVQHSGN